MNYKKKGFIFFVFFIIVIQILLVVNNNQKKSFRYFIWEIENISIGKYVDTLAFGTYKRNVFKKIGGYDIELLRNQDDEFNFRMLQKDLKIWLHPSIKSYYYPKTEDLLQWDSNCKSR